MHNSDLDLEVTHLLVSSGFLMPYDLDRALACRRDTGQPLMDVLLENKFVDQGILRCAYGVLEHIYKSRLPRESARAALYMVGNCRMSVPEAFTKLGFQSTANPWLDQLTRLAQSKKWDTAS